MTDNVAFTKAVYAYYKNNKRDLPWRHSTDSQFAYYVFISEMMLQQTQVGRVTDKFNEWIERFPTIDSVANATLLDVMKCWSGLGYNRRANYVYEAAKTIASKHNGLVPNDLAGLLSLPGIGHNTAAAILAYAYNMPTIFIETNIRSVYMYHYFKDAIEVSDKEILRKVSLTLDTNNPRDWYWALMDYGTYIKKQKLVSLSKSKSYKKQPSFSGSNRQLRGVIIASLIQNPKTISQLRVITNNDKRLKLVVEALVSESLIDKNGQKYQIAS